MNERKTTLTLKEDTFDRLCRYATLTGMSIEDAADYLLSKVLKSDDNTSQD